MTRFLFVRIAERNLYSPQANRNFSLKKVSRMNRSAVNNAEMLKKAQDVQEKEKHSSQFVLNAAEKQDFLSNRAMNAKFTAATVSLKDALNCAYARKICFVM
jgi:hypothetical protein